MPSPIEKTTRFSRYFSRITVVLLVTVFVLGGLFTPRPAQAACFSFTSGISLSECVAGVFTGIGYIFSYIGGVFFGLANYLVQFAFHLNLGVADSSSNSILGVGWKILRDVANLGFVLFIILIAFATILRVGEEQYGVKKLLPKLIIAAILVNFSLTIGSAVINFTNVLTNFFMQKVDNTATISGFGNQLANAFSPQRFFTGGENPLPPNPEDEVSGLTAFGASVLTGIVSLVFVVVFTFLAALTMIALAAMLLLRYLWLTFLLILSPLIWLFWVIPVLSSQYSKWWDHFLKWTFFAPAVSFFIYLALVAVQEVGKQQAALTSYGSGPLSGLGSLAQAVLLQGAQMLIVCGFMIGGIIVAQSMGITGAKAAIGIAQKVGTGVQGWAGRKATQAGAAGLASAPVTGTAKALQRIPGLRKVGMALGGQSEVMRSRLVSDADSRLKKYSDGHLAKNLDALSAPERVAAMERLSKNDTVGLIEKDGKKNPVAEVTQKNSDLFKSYGKANKWKDFEIGAGMNVASADALKARNEDGLQSAMAEWIKGLKPEQIAKLPVNTIFNGKSGIDELGPKNNDEQSAEMLREALIRGIALNVPSDLAKLFNKVKGAGFEQLERKTKLVGGNISATDKGRGDKIKDVLDKIASLRLYTTPEQPTAQTATAAPSPTPKTP